MAYEKQTWVTGEVIKAADLNHMENGIAGASGNVVYFPATADTTNSKYVLTDATVGDIVSAMHGGNAVCLLVSGGSGNAKNNRFVYVTNLNYSGTHEEPTIIFLGGYGFVGINPGYSSLYAEWIKAGSGFNADATEIPYTRSASPVIGS